MTFSNDLFQIYNDNDTIKKHLLDELSSWTAVNILGDHFPCFYKGNHLNISDALSGNCLPAHMILRKYLIENYQWVQYAYIEIGLTETFESAILEDIKAPDLSCVQRGKLAYSHLNSKFHVWLKIRHTNGKSFILDLTSFRGDYVSKMKYVPFIVSKSSKSAFFLSYIKDALSGIDNADTFVRDAIRKYGL